MIDFKKTQKDLYQPKSTPSIVDVPEMIFIMVDGRGDPNDPQGAYAAAIEVLYGLSYAVKMGNKQTLEYVVPPLEGLWTVDDIEFDGRAAKITDKGKFRWTAMIRQPDFVTPAIFETAKAALQKKKPGLELSPARREVWTEGLCVQVMHLGSYDDEPGTVERLERFITESGFRSALSGDRRHHEIYLGDPRKTAPEKVRTVIRHPVCRKEN
ncbi:MAG: GyrI-like domain-containing protein [Spirochaetaceae bacterium]|jgi:hypothetical protein|nr:GyrI-like domain-containing protein [Spirochaetaceae bacterium]